MQYSNKWCAYHK